MKRTLLVLCCAVLTAGVSGCGETSNAPMSPDSVRSDNGGSLGGGGRSGTGIATDSTTNLAPANGGSLGGGG